MHKYKIGQLSKAMGVSTHLLKHYEKFDLVSPVKDDSTNYRYYDTGQCIRIIASKKYRNMGFALKDTTMLINQMDAKGIEEAVENQIRLLEEQINELEQQKYLALQYRNDSQEMDRKLGQWFIQELEEFYFIKQTDNMELLEEVSLENMGNGLLDCAPIAKSMVLIDAATFRGEDISYHWGLALKSENLANVKKYNLTLNEQDSNIQKVSRQRAFIAYFRIEAPYMENHHLMEEIQKQYHMFDSELRKAAYAELVKAENVENTRFHYFRVIIPL